MYLKKGRPMPTTPMTDCTNIDKEAEEIMADPKVQAALEALDSPEDREDLIEHLKALKRVREGKEKVIPWDEAVERLGIEGKLTGN
jgi:hypothetical protein